MLKLHVLGVGDAFTERYHNACLCIEEPSSGTRLLIDCPPALPRVLADHRQRSGSDLSVWNIDPPVSYTHLDVYKRQARTWSPRPCRRGSITSSSQYELLRCAGWPTSQTLSLIHIYFYAERIMPGGTDRGGVHLNSGMPNLVHVLLTQGGKHPRSKTTVEVPAIGLGKSLQIFYLSNSKLLTASATFETARYATAQAARTLYGRCAPEVIATGRAWDAIGVPGLIQPCVRPPSHF